ncbi:hypothetical protein [Amycolatopsis sp.]|uniref:hypothetical protein n=1 Tax=Amycolatopsis sp. TaxID=37632 RepID=UPI002CB9B1E9|nr:hypothetical protein [Amycolatopsis sp.]HVV09523.1 hypothetical protein [Amycolatopsis sp.]
MRVPARFRAVLCFLLTALLAAVFLAPATAAEGEAACSAQEATVEQNQQQIDAHNAAPHVFTIPGQEGELAAYDAEATQLNAAEATAEANLASCEQATNTLDDSRPGSKPTKTPTPEKLNQIGDAQKKIPPDWKPQPAPPQGKNWQVPPNDPARDLYLALRESPDSRYIGDTPLQGRPRPQIGDDDPAYDGRTIPQTDTDPPGPDVSPDHIVPLAEIMNMPGFVRLTPDSMYRIVNAPLNMQWLSRKANRSKQSRSVLGMRNVNPEWQQQQDELQQQIRRQLLDIIQQLLKSQG